MSQAVADLLAEVAGLLNDREPGAEYVRWTKLDLLEYMNDGVMQAFLVRPQLFSHNETIDLVPGAAQTLPDGCNLQKMLGTDGETKPARKLDESMLAIYGGQSCNCSCGPYKIDGYTSNPTDPNHFFVDPPVPDDGVTHKATITCLQEPKPVAAVVDGSGAVTDFNPADLSIKGKLHNAVIEWMLYRAYSVDMESPQSNNKMTFHVKHFYEMLGLDEKLTDKLVAEQMGKIKGQAPSVNVGGAQ